MLKCPNPSCPYAFDPSQVPTGVVLSCPRCAMQFTLGAPTAAPSGTTAQMPTRAPAPVTEPDFEAVGQTAVEDRDQGAPAPGRRTNRYQVVILAGIAAVLMAGTALAIIFKVMNRNSRDPSRPGAVLTDKDRNIGLDALPAGWVQDDATRKQLGSPYLYGFKRENPEAYVALGAFEYAKGRSPRSSEMRRDLLLPMGKLFIASKVEEELGLETNWLGQVIGKRHGFKFRAPSGNGLVWQGETYTVSTKGVAYYWVSWCGEGDFDRLEDEFAKFRGKFKLLGTRDDWREKVPKEMPYKGATTSYTFTDAEDIWVEKPVEAEKVLNPDLDRLLRINHTARGDRQALPDDADLRVYLLDGGGDPLERAREYVQSLWVTHVKTASDGAFPDPTFTELTDDPQGDEVTKGSAPFVRLESRVVDPATKKVIASTESRLIVASGVRVGEKIVVLHCWCELGKREVFESRFIQIASSLR